MTNASSSNVPPLDTALPTVPQKMRSYNTHDESAFLTQQAADAKAAMQHTLAEMQATAKQAANVRWWTQQYPWYAVGAAAVLGFAATTKVLAPANPAAPPVQTPTAGSSLMSSLVEIIRTTVMSTIMGAIHANGEPKGHAQTQAAPPEPAEQST